MRFHLRPRLFAEPLESRLLLDAEPTHAGDYADHDHESVPEIRLEGGGRAGDKRAPRATAAGPNLTINNARLVSGDNLPVSSIATGQMIFVRAEYTISDVTPGTQYVVRYWLDGVPVDSGTITAPSGTANWTWYRGVGYASAGTHSVQVTVDGANTVAETSETDNTFTFDFAPVAPTTLPQKFVWPLRGAQSKHFMINNYLDVDPRAGVLSDFAGGPFMYDGHTGYDVGPSGFDTMDASVSVHAAAAGVVGAVQDGNFDRQTTQGSHPANYVEITHGNGWRTIYYHFSTSTIVVKSGDVVAAGQLLGLMGSSGSSTGSHLHLGVFHDQAPVETYYDPAAYWQNPLPYQPTTAPDVMDSGTTNYAAPSTEYRERISTVELFPTSAGWTVYFWNELSHLRPSDVATVRWYRPSGAVHLASNFSPTSIVRSPLYWWTLSGASVAPHPGQWQVALSINGVERSRRHFTVTTGAGQPEMRLYQGSTYVLDGRTTGIDFGSVAFGGTPPTRDFTIQNHGAAPLSISGISLPPDFSLASTLPSTVPAGGSAAFTLRLDSDWGGTKFGQVELTTSDADESSFTFNVKGSILWTAPPSTWPHITTAGPAAPYSPGRPPQVLDATATVFDSNSSHFGGGHLLVEMAGFTDDDDRLAIRHQGTVAGQIGVSGSNVLYGGVPIGAFTGGAGAIPLVITFNTAATVAATQALLRNLTYESAAAFPPVVRRYVRVQLTDDTGKISGMPVKTVTFDTIAPSAVPFAWMSGSRLNVRFDNGSPITLRSDGTGDVATRGGETLTFGGVGEVVVFGSAGDDVLRLDSLARPLAFRNGAGDDAIEALSGTHAFSSDLSPLARNLAVFVAAGATVDFAATQHLRALDIDGVVRFTPGAGQLLETESLMIGPGGVLDLADNDLLVDYDSGDPNPYEQISQYVIDGRASRVGIVGADAPDGDQLLAVADNVHLGTMTFNGVEIDETTIVCRYTYYGDANMDGQVTTDDYVVVDLNLGRAEPQWVHGDLDMSGQVTTDDYVVVDLNLGKGTTFPAAGSEEESFGQALSVESVSSVTYPLKKRSLRFGPTKEG